MTDKTPATEAGRLAVNEEGVRPSLILAIEAEARAYWVQRATECEAWVEAHPLEVAVAEARADALREAATDTTPATEAGRRLADDPDNLPHGLLVTRILAIEAEARAEALDVIEEYLRAMAVEVRAILAAEETP